LLVARRSSSNRMSTLQAASALLDLCSPSASSTESMLQGGGIAPAPRLVQPTKAVVLSQGNPLLTYNKQTKQHQQSCHNLLQAKHRRWQHALRESLAYASPLTFELIEPATALGPLEAALLLSRLSPLEVSLLDAPVRYHVVSFRRRAAALLWHNPNVDVKGAIQKSRLHPAGHDSCHVSLRAPMGSTGGTVVVGRLQRPP